LPLANWIKKEDPTICCLQETHLTDSKPYSERVEEELPSYWPLKTGRVTTLTSDKVDEFNLN
jgi:exonuclease III